MLISSQYLENKGKVLNGSLNPSHRSELIKMDESGPLDQSAADLLS